MEEKYEFTGETMEYKGVVLHRIRALRDFGKGKKSVHKGDLGGWVQSEFNLSHEGNCWVYDNAKVYDDAFVSGNARIFVNACVYGHANVEGSATIEGNAEVFGDASVSKKAKIRRNAKVHGNATIYGHAVVDDSSIIDGNAVIYSDVRITDHAFVHGTVLIGGCACVKDNADVSGMTQVGGYMVIGENAVVKIDECNILSLALLTNARLLLDAYITKENDFLVIGPIGSRHARTTFYKARDGRVFVACGCFNGPLDEFEKEVHRTHNYSKYETEYLKAIECAKEVLLS